MPWVVPWCHPTTTTAAAATSPSEGILFPRFLGGVHHREREREASPRSFGLSSNGFTYGLRCHFQLRVRLLASTTVCVNNQKQREPRRVIAAD